MAGSSELEAGYSTTVPTGLQSISPVSSGVQTYSTMLSGLLVVFISSMVYIVCSLYASVEPV